MKSHEDQDASEVIAGIFSLYDIEMHALIDPSSTYSYVCIEHVCDKITSVERLLYDMHVTSPLAQIQDGLFNRRRGWWWLWLG